MQPLWSLVLGLRAWLIGLVVYFIAYSALFGETSASGVAGTGALLGFFFGSVALARSAWPIRVTSSRPPMLIAGLRRYTVNTFTGRVAGASKVAQLGVQSTAQRVRIHTQVQDDVVLVGVDGGQHNVQVTGANLRVGQGQLVSAVWAIPAGRKRGPYVFFRNHTTNDNTVPLVPVWKLSAGRGVSFFVVAMWLGGILLMGDGHGNAGLLWFFPLPMAYILLNYLQVSWFRGAGSARLVRYLDENAATFPSGQEPAPVPVAPAAVSIPPPPAPPPPPLAPAPDPAEPARWLPDPFGLHEHRYWDGGRWTEHVADAGHAGVDAPRSA